MRKVQAFMQEYAQKADYAHIPNSTRKWTHHTARYWVTPLFGAIVGSRVLSETKRTARRKYWCRREKQRAGQAVIELA
jgi:hypothetical protein